MDEEQFMQAFEDVKRVSIFNGRALADEVGKIRDILAKSSNDWKVGRFEMIFFLILKKYMTLLFIFF